MILTLRRLSDPMDLALLDRIIFRDTGQRTGVNYSGEIVGGWKRTIAVHVVGVVTRYWRLSCSDV